MAAKLVTNADSVVPVTFVAGQTVSTVARIGGAVVAAVQFAASFPTGAILNFDASTDEGTTYQKVYDTDGTEYAVIAPAAGGIVNIGRDAMPTLHDVRMRVTFAPSYVHDTDLTVNILTRTGG